MQPVIKWSGSKRIQANEILKYFPDNYDVYYEPFVGGGSILYAAQPKNAVCGDICEPLIELWNYIKDNPIKLSKEYESRWQSLQNDGYEVYYQIRDRFNKSKSPEDFMFLSRTCVNGLIRFNAKGEFNNSLHHTRPGINPTRLTNIILDWSSKIQNVAFVNADYRESTKKAKKGDLVYLDPPYFHTKGRYYGTIDFDEFTLYLEELNEKGVKYILSFDGKGGNRDYTVKLPPHLYKRHIYIKSGNSTFRKVIDKEKELVLESLYLNW